MLWLFVRSLLMLLVGTTAGFMGAAALMRSWLPSRGDASSDELALATIFDSVELASQSATFRGGTILAWYGGVSLDLRAATLGPGARLDIRAIFGGISITVPPTWRIDGSGTGFAGGVSVPSTDPADPEAPTLIVRATTIFGGVAVTRRG
ncbi:MAG TPA: hypothetical protein VLA76_01985 [Candidatus Angelobacter sp.]|nr:hypothetical protein [Candidatus Angelobacter sp.]